MDIKFSYANCTAVYENTRYPNTAIVKDINELSKYMKYDYTFIEFKKGHRCGDDFIRAEYATFDVDNTETDDESKWIQIEDIKTIFPNVWCLIITSQNHLKVKKGRKPRPKFHIVFRINEIKTPDEYRDFMKKVQRVYTFFDSKATDAGRFMAGCETSEYYEFQGTKNLSDHMRNLDKEEEFFNSSLYEGEIVEGTRSDTMIRIATSLLKRYGDTQEAYEKYLENAERCVPPLDDSELETIYGSGKKYYEVLSKKPDYILPEEYSKPSWDEPIPLEEDKTPIFPIHTLPDKIKRYVEELAESTQTPLDMAASATLATLAVCSQGNYKIQGKKDWIEPLNLYFCIVAEPSERKSAIVSNISKPLIEYEQLYNEEHNTEFEKNQTMKRVLEKKRTMIEQNFVKGKATMDDLDNVSKEISEFKELTPLKLYVDDVTTEKLNQVLATNNGKAAIISSEGGIFDLLAGIYTKNVNIDVFLKGYSGDTIRVDRVGRDCEIINDPRLSILLTVQPSVLKGLVTNPAFRGRGLTARFLYSYPTSKVGSRCYRSQCLSDFAYDDYKSVLFNILQDDKELLITLSKGADKLLEEFANEIEPLLNTELKPIGDWAGKLVGTVLRISGLLTRASITIDHNLLGDDDEKDLKKKLVVSKEIMKNAIEIGKYYLEHAKASFALMGTDAVTKDSIYIIEHLKKNGITEFSVRDIMRSCRNFKTKDSLLPILTRLSDYGYIMLKETTEQRLGRPGSTKYLVNPSLAS